MWKYDKRLVFILSADVFVSALLPFPNVLISGRIVDSIIAGENFQFVISFVLLLFGLDYILMLLSTLLAKAREYLFIKLVNKLDNNVNCKCLNMDFEQFNDPAMQDRILMTNQAIRGNNYFTSLTTIFAIISRLITLVGIIFVMTKLNIWLLFIAILIVILQALLHYIRLKFDRKYIEDSANDRRKNAYVSQLAKDIQSKKVLLCLA